MTLINGDKIITTQLYDDEHEEYTEKKMSIIDFVNAFSDEGITTADDVLNKIRTDLYKLYNDRPSDYNHTQRTELFCEVIKIIDKYKGESEVQDANSN